MIRILRRPAVEERIGLRRSSLYAAIAEGVFPPPIAIGSRAVGWPESEVTAVVNARIRGESANDVRLLVSRLVAERASCGGDKA